MDQEKWEGFRTVHHPSTIAYIEENWGKAITLEQFSQDHLKTCKSKKGKPSHVRHMFKHIVEQGWIKDASASV